MTPGSCLDIDFNDGENSDGEYVLKVCSSSIFGNVNANNNYNVNLPGCIEYFDETCS